VISQVLAPTSSQALTDKNRLFRLPPVPLFDKPTEKLQNKSPSVQNDQPKKINNFHASQQPPVPHSASNPLIIQQQLPIQSKPHVNQNTVMLIQNNYSLPVKLHYFVFLIKLAP
jgi:hypothetical protein